MPNEDRFWEASISEAVRDVAPPDVTARVLTALAEVEPPVDSETSARRPRRLIRGAFRICAELAAAAAVVLAIAWATGFLSFDQSEGTHSDEVTEPLLYAASPDAVILENENTLELKQGWLLVTTGSPDVLCDGSILTQIDGRVLLHAGSMPSREQAEAVQQWLAANQLEKEMIGNPKRWITTATLAVLVLAGSAQLDGQRVEAQEEAPVTTPAPWHPVQSVMDIETLPKDVRWVDISSLKAAHLEFLSKHPQVVGIDARNVRFMEGSHLEALAKLENLEHLDMSGARWSGEFDYRPLKKLTSLKKLVIDYTPLPDIGAGGLAKDYPAEYHIVSTLKHLIGHGTRVYLGNVSVDAESLLELLDEIPGITDLDLTGSIAVNNPNVLKRLAEVASLRSLALNTDDLGLAYLAESPSLESLTVKSMISEAILYQLGKFRGLKTLEIEHANLEHANRKTSLVEPGALGSEVSHLDQLTTLRTLKIDWGVKASNRAETTFQIIEDIVDGIPALETLEFTQKIDAADVRRFLEQLNGVSVSNLLFKVEELANFLPSPEKASENELIAPFPDVQYLSVASYYYYHHHYERMTAGYDDVLSKLIKLFPNLKTFRHGIDRISNSDVEGFEAAIERVRETHPKLTVDAFYKVNTR